MFAAAVGSGSLEKTPAVGEAAQVVPLREGKA